MKGVYQISGLKILIEFNYSCTEKFLSAFKIKDGDSAVDFSVFVNKNELEKECFENNIKRISYYEHLFILRLINKELVNNYGGFMLHSSSVLVGDKAFCFTAKSGTGKSTHAGNLKTLLKERLKYINDDKPFIRYFEKEDKFVVYGNPWNGKHKLGENLSAELGAIIYIERAKENIVEEISARKALPLLFSQIVYPETEEEVKKISILLNKLFEKTPMYLLKCNKEIDSAKLSFEKIIKNNL